MMWELYCVCITHVVTLKTNVQSEHHFSKPLPKTIIGCFMSWIHLCMNMYIYLCVDCIGVYYTCMYVICSSDSNLLDNLPKDRPWTPYTSTEPDLNPEVTHQVLANTPSTMSQSEILLTQPQSTSVTPDESEFSSPGQPYVNPRPSSKKSRKSKI